MTNPTPNVSEDQLPLLEPNAMYSGDPGVLAKWLSQREDQLFAALREIRQLRQLMVDMPWPPYMMNVKRPYCAHCGCLEGHTSPDCTVAQFEAKQSQLCKEKP